jgi:hypothetical protein
MEKLYEYTLKRQLEEQKKEMGAMQEKLDKLTTIVERVGEQKQLVLAGHEQQLAKPPKASLAPTPKAALKTAPRAAISIATRDNSSATVAIDQSTKNVTINFFGKEDISHITRGSIMKLFESVTGKSGPLDELLPAAQMAIMKATMLIYSDEKYPENITCYLPNKKTNDVLIHGESGWEIKPYEIAVSPMAARAISVLFDKQPLPGEDGVSVEADIERCGTVLRYMADNETLLTNKPPPGMRPVLIRNKEMLNKFLEKLPVGAQNKRIAHVEGLCPKILKDSQ